MKDYLHVGTKNNICECGLFSILFELFYWLVFLMPRKETPPSVREAICTMYKNGSKVSDIAKSLSMHRSTVSSIIQGFKKSGSATTSSRTGRPKKLAPRDLRRLNRLIMTHRRTPLTKVYALFNKDSGTNLCKRTLDKYCRQLGFTRSPSTKKQVLKDRHCRARIMWCKPRRYWTVEQNWSKVIFSDESMVKIGDNYRVYVWKKSGEGYRPDLYGQKENSIKSRFKVMIWGCISYNGIGTLDFIEGNIDSKKYLECLERNLWPVISKEFPQGGAIFQDDGAPVHTARIVQSWKTENNVRTLPWPAYSPDFNIIENAWFIVKHQLQKEVLQIKSQADLEERIRRIWESLTLGYIRTLYASMPNRIRQCQLLKGHRTKY